MLLEFLFWEHICFVYTVGKLPFLLVDASCTLILPPFVLCERDWPGEPSHKGSKEVGLTYSIGQNEKILFLKDH